MDFYLNSALASLEALQNGYDEAILLTDQGYVCEGPGDNTFLVKNGKLITPSPADHILEGITRNTVMVLAKEELQNMPTSARRFIREYEIVAQS